MAAKKKAAPKKAAAKKMVKPIPDGYHQITPYLAVKGAGKAIDFYKKAFGAKERLRMDAPGGLIGHAELTIGDSVLMLADEYPPLDLLGPQSRGGTSVTIHLYAAPHPSKIPSATSAMKKGELG